MNTVHPSRNCPVAHNWGIRKCSSLLMRFWNVSDRAYISAKTNWHCVVQNLKLDCIFGEVAWLEEVSWYDEKFCHLSRGCVTWKEKVEWLRGGCMMRAEMLPGLRSFWMIVWVLIFVFTARCCAKVNRTKVQRRQKSSRKSWKALEFSRNLTIPILYQIENIKISTLELTPDEMEHAKGKSLVQKCTEIVEWN